MAACLHPEKVMPRKPPRNLRRPHYQPDPQPHIAGLTVRTQAAIRHVEDVHFRPGVAAYSLAVYQELLRERRDSFDHTERIQIGYTVFEAQ